MEDGSFYATFFLCEEDQLLTRVNQPRGGVITEFDSDPYHYTRRQIEWIASQAGLVSEHVEWDHPRSQRMVRFSRPAAAVDSQAASAAASSEPQELVEPKGGS